MKRNFLLLLLAFVTVACTDTLEEGKKEVGDPNISVLPEVGGYLSDEDRICFPALGLGPSGTLLQDC